MAKQLPLHSKLGQLVIGQQPRMAFSATNSSTRGQTGGGSRQTWIHTDRGRKIILGEVEPLICSRLPNIKSAFRVVDHDGTGLVSKEEFRQVLKNLLSLNQNQLSEVCEGSGATVDYMQFLRRYSGTPVAQRPSSSHSSMRIGPQNSSLSLSEIQNHLKHKIGGNLRTVIRVFRLFDHNREGNIQQHEFRHILDNYCIHLTDKEFRRLWHHYCPSNTANISYELFLDKLGFGDSHNFRIAPVCTKLVVSSQGTTPFERVNQKKQRAESPSSSCDTPSHRNLHTLFYDKMCMNSTPVWQALQAFDTTCSGWVKRDVLRVVLSSFIFPMNPHSFQKLTSRYGVKTTGPVRWKHFLGHFMSPVKEEGDTKLHTDRSCEHPAPEENNLNFQDIYPQLKEIFSVLDMKVAGGITRADLRHLLERPSATWPRIPLPQQQITELFNVLDSENSGVIQLASLERLNPNKTSAPTCNTSPPAPPSPTNTTDHLENPEETKGTTTKSEEQKTPDERETTQWADKVSVASASQRTVESLLLDKLCENLSSVLEELKLCDPQHTGYITQEDLKRILSCYGMPISDTHFNKLCKPCNSRPGRSSSLVSYNGFFSNLGIPLSQGRNTSLSHEDSDHTERGQRPPSSLQVGPETKNIMDTVFQRMRSRLEQRHTSLTKCIQAIIHNSEAVDLSETDLRKILEDSWVILDDENFNKFTEQLGFMDGRIERSVFQAKYEEATARAAGQQGSEGGDGDNIPLLTSAEQCLAAFKTKIKIIHGKNLTAFRLMDRKCRGVVDCCDFRVLYNSLGFFCSEGEYERLLDLIGLHPGGNLNYAEFVDIVENNGRQRVQSASVQEQLHELLAHEARYKWADMSKVLCQSDAVNQGRIDKKSLRGLLFTYALPMNSNEFDRLWSRYDPEGRGSVAVCDFLEKLGCHHEGVVRSQSQKLRKTVVHLNADRPVSSDTASLERIEQILQKNYNELSNALTHLETSRDGTVTVAELLSLLHNFSCPIQREQLVHHLHSFKVSMDDNCKRLSYMDFLSMFDHKGEKCEPPPSSPDAVHQIESLDNLSPDMALSRMRELVTASAPNLYKAFSAFDQSGTGMVRAVDFRQVLESFCARLSDKQYRYLLTKLELNCDNSTVNWTDFLNKFQSQSPSISDRALSGSREQGAKSRPSAQFPQQVQEMVSGHLNPSNSNTMSKEQFRQLCDRHCLSLTNDQMPVTEQRKLQYREHMKGSGKLDRTLHTTAEGPSNDMSSPSPEPRETATATKPCCPNCAGAILQCAKCISRRPASVGRPATGSSSGSMERKLRGGVQRCWKEIQKKCADEDPQQDGHVTTASFLGILQSLNISMTEEQFENLAAKFDIINNGCVSYHTFFHHFLLNLKPAETTREFERRRLPLPITQMSQGVLSKDCVEVMLRTYNVVCSSWTSIRRSFLASDRTRTGSVSVQDFRKVLRHFGVNLSEEDFFQLCSYFDANTTGKICYNNFLWAFLH